jgi:2-polyprenyl-3-methyl-5-hydroxy-6-metoxy-1,4-benzoquinol methylase
MQYKIPGYITLLKLIFNSIYYKLNKNEKFKKSWDVEFENNYWDNNLSNNNLNELHAKLKFMNYFEIISEYSLNIQEHYVADFGGGPFGGVLPLVFGSKKFLVDLIDVNLNVINSEKIIPIKASFTDQINLPLKLDVIFCLEALDHLNDMNEFRKSVNNISNSLKNGGLFFFEMPIRNRATDGHPISLAQYSRNSIVDIFRQNGFKVIHKINFGPSFGSPNSFIVVCKKVV